MSKVITGPYTTEPGPRRKWGDWVIWAEDGMVFMEDQRDGQYYALPRRTARDRKEAFEDELIKWDEKKSSNGSMQDRAYAIEHYSWLKTMIECVDEAIKEAKAQGDPNDEVVRQHKLKAFLRSKRAGIDDSNLPTVDATMAALNGVNKKKSLLWLPPGV